MPFAAMTPVIMTHRFFGRSVADLVMDIQRIKTSMLRGIADNVYLANNQRLEVAESLRIRRRWMTSSTIASVVWCALKCRVASTPFRTNRLAISRIGSTSASRVVMTLSLPSQIRIAQPRFNHFDTWEVSREYQIGRAHV